MSYYNLDVESMVGVSNGWVQGSMDRAILENQPMLAPLIPELQNAHDNLIAIQVNTSANSEELKRLGEQARKLDAVHDRKLRGIYNTLTAFSELADDTIASDAYLQARDTLFDEGLRGVLRSYLAESGNVVLVDGRLTTTLREELAALPVPQGTLLNEIDSWISAGKELGNVERKRVQLSQTQDKEAVSLTDVNNARSRWVSVVETVMHIIDVIPNLEEDLRNRIVQPLHTAVEKATQARKAKFKNETEENTEPGAPETASAETGTTETP